MAEPNNANGTDDPMSRTRAEIKELRAKIQGLKKAVPKGDKKKKKETNSEISRLEQELKKLEIFKSEIGASSFPDDGSVQQDNPGTTQEHLEQITVDETPVGVASGTKKKSKAQRRKEKKSQQERERDERIADEEAQSTLNNPRLVEQEQLAAVLSPLGLVIKDVPADGHCLYAAVSDQLSCRVGVKVGVSRLRVQCSEYIASHSEDFLPYLVDPDTGDQFTPDKFTAYCDEIATTAAWGGHMEIQALSHVYKVPVKVYQATAPALMVGEEYGNTPLTLSYHHHEYGLGEHYNSVIPHLENT